MRSFLVLLILAVPAFAQLRESIEVSVLELDVAVVDRRGKPVDGLTSADFQVDIGGKRAEVTNFYAVRRSAIVEEAATAAAAPRGTVASETAIPTTIIIFIDDTRLTPRGKERAIKALREYLVAHAGQTTSAMIVRWNGSLDVRSRPADRPGPLLAILDKMATEAAMLNDSDRRYVIERIDDALTGRSGIKFAQAVQNSWRDVINYADRQTRDVERTLDALQEVTRLAGGFEGRKSLLYISEGLPLSPAAELFEYWNDAMSSVGQNIDGHLLDIGQDSTTTLEPAKYDRTRQYQKLARQAQAMNVAFFAVDVRGVRGFEGRGAETVTNVAQLDPMLLRTNAEDGVRLVADETGGRFIGSENDLGRALAVISEQFTTYYSLGVRAPATTRLMKVKVSVKGRPELRVLAARHRRPMTRQEELEQTVRSRLYSPRAENPLAAQVSLGTPFPANAQCVVPMRLDVAGPQSSVDLYFALLDERNQESDVRSTNILPATDRRVAHSMSLGVKPGKYVLSVAIADRTTGETSYVQHNIDATRCR